MFSPADRDALRDELVAIAGRDDRVVGAALTGSAALGHADRWSDIDLALGIDAATEPLAVMADWTAMMYAEHGARHHTDLVRGPVVYRVFLLDSTLQVDVAFAPTAQFGAIGPTFRLLFGTATDLGPPPEPDPVAMIGRGWLYALHVRSSVERGRVWQAEYMISGMRNGVVALACLRHGLPVHDGRGVDRLPPAVTASLVGTLVRAPDAGELARAFRAVTDALLVEIRLLDADLAARLEECLHELAATSPAAG